MLLATTSPTSSIFENSSIFAFFNLSRLPKYWAKEIEVSSPV